MHSSNLDACASSRIPFSQSQNHPPRYARHPFFYFKFLPSYYYYGHLTWLLGGTYSSGLFVCRQPWLMLTCGFCSLPTNALGLAHVAERSAAMMQATAPATAGVAMEVPDMT